MSHPNWSALIFDMDGVLCDSEPLTIAAGVRMFRERHGVEVHPEDFHPFVGCGQQFFLGVAQKHGVTLDLDRDANAAYDHYLAAIDGVLEPYPGVVELLERCSAAGLPCAVATSAKRRKAQGNLAQLRLGPLFRTVVTGEDIAHNKPAPDIFIEAASRLGADPAGCLVIEDSPHGIRGAIAAGMKALGLSTTHDAEVLRQAGASWVAPSWLPYPEPLAQFMDSRLGRNPA